MRSQASVAMAAIAICALSKAVRPQVPTSAAQLPVLSGDTLNSHAVLLPRDLSADRTLLLIAFARAQQSQIDSWTKGLQDKVPWLELPIIEPSNAFVRAMIAGGMRRGIPSPAVRDHVITVYTAPDPVARAVGCMNYRKQVCVAVVDKSGAIRLVMEGAYSVQGVRQIDGQMSGHLVVPAVAP